MATKKKICKQLRAMTAMEPRKPMRTYVDRGGKTVQSEIGGFTNPDRRLKRAYKRGEFKLQKIA